MMYKVVWKYKRLKNHSYTEYVTTEGAKFILDFLEGSHACELVSITLYEE